MRVRFQLSSDLTYREIDGSLNDFVRVDRWTPDFGCYKITYNDGLFYIGMSYNLVQRIGQHLEVITYPMNQLVSSDTDFSIYLNKDKPIRNHRKFVRMAQAYRMSETVLFEKIDDCVENERRIIEESSGPMCLNVRHNSFWGYRKKQQITISDILSGKIPEGV
jgi:hypothetical protein